MLKDHTRTPSATKPTKPCEPSALTSSITLATTSSPDSGIRVLTTPLRIDRRGRKFEEVKDIEMPDLNSQVEVIEVVGSKGKTYYITMSETPSCSCPGYQFRGNCKHVKELDAQ